MKTPRKICALGIDYGLKNIGLAYGQSLTQTAQALPAIKAKDGIPNWEQMEQVLSQWQPDIVVIGLPLNMDGSESELCKRVRKFGNRLHGRFNAQIDYMDERLSSVAVKEEEKARGHKGDYGKNPIDSLAAQLILEDWLRAYSFSQD